MNNRWQKYVIAFLMCIPIAMWNIQMLPDMYWTRIVINGIVFYATVKIIGLFWDNERDTDLHKLD